MNCSKIKTIILTDYIDGILDDKTSREVEAHLEKCLACKKFYENALKFAVLPLRQGEKKPLPGYLYSKVLQKINDYEKHSLLYKIFTERKIVAPVISFAAAALLIISAYFIGFSVRTARTVSSNGMESMTNIYEETSSGTQNDKSPINYGSTAEELFL